MAPDSKAKAHQVGVDDLRSQLEEAMQQYRSGEKFSVNVEALTTLEGNQKGTENLTIISRIAKALERLSQIITR